MDLNHYPYHPWMVYLLTFWLILIVHVGQYAIHGCYGWVVLLFLNMRLTWTPALFVATCHLMVAQNVSQGPLGINWQRFFGHGSRIFEFSDLTLPYTKKRFVNNTYCRDAGKKTRKTYYFLYHLQLKRSERKSEPKFLQDFLLAQLLVREKTHCLSVITSPWTNVTHGQRVPWWWSFVEWNSLPSELELTGKTLGMSLFHGFQNIQYELIWA